MKIYMLAAPLLVAVLGALTVGCGSSSSGGSGGGSGSGSGGFACTETTQGVSACTEVQGYTSAEETAAKKVCTMSGGKAVDSCPTAKLVGCCESTVKSGTTSFSSFSCFYTGTAASLKSACEMTSGDKWVTKP